ncbi:monocarboxylate transporter 12-like isoform X2 [Apostichopus japonicus]
MLQYTTEHLQTSNTLVAWAYTLQCGISFLMAPLCGPLLQYCSYRSLGVTGGFLSGFGYVCAGLLASKVWHLFIFHAMSGIGFGLVCLPPFLYMHALFDDVTFAIISSATGVLTYVGISVLPLVMNWLVGNYGHSTALVLIGMILMNNMILGIAMRPLKPSTCEQSASASAYGTIATAKLHPCDRYGFIFSALFRHKNFAICMLFAAAGMLVYSSWAIFLVSFGNDLNFSAQQSVLLSTAGGIGGIGGGLLPILLFKLRMINPITGCLLPSTVNAIALLVSVYMTKFSVVFCLMVVSGFSQGFQYAAICGFIPLVLCKYHFQKGLPLSFFMEGILYQLGGLTAGILTDLTGSSLAVFTVNGIVCLIVAPFALLWFCDKRPISECYSVK